MTATFPTTVTIGQLATTQPWSTAVFHRHRIDFCCGGARRLDEVCDEKGLQVADVLAEIAREAPAEADFVRWDEAPLNELIDHLQTFYHDRLWEELPRLTHLATKVASVHGGRDARLEALRDLVVDIETELSEHMRKEEQVLFPWIHSGRGASAHRPVQVMQHEHEEHGQKLQRLRELTGDFQLPIGACASWTALWHGLERLERELHDHIHLENNILFPRALASRPPAEPDAGVIDVRTIPPWERHPRIFQTFDQLSPGGHFTLVNDHDPRPLYSQFRMNRGPIFTWDYLEAGPEVWRVRIGRV